MGLLDDAIREHLELKRRRGADPSEIAREEAEALGPVRREAAEPLAEDELPAAESMSHHEVVADPEPPVYGGLEDPGAAYAVEEEPAPVEPYEPHEPAVAPHEPAAEPVPDEGPTHHDAPYPETERETATPPHGDPFMPHPQPTREFSSDEVEAALGDPAAAPPEDVVPADAEDGEEDVLEETPEFLQETPEHDRLWFEQKPPKDFDF